MRVALLAVALVLALPARGQTGSAPDPVFQIDFTNPSLVPSHWTLTLHPSPRRAPRGPAPSKRLV